MFDVRTDEEPLRNLIYHLKKKKAALLVATLEANDLKNELKLIDEKMLTVKFTLRLLKSNSRFQTIYAGYFYTQEVKRDLDTITITPIATIDDVLPSMVYRYMFNKPEIAISTLLDNPFDFVNAERDALAVENVFKRRLNLSEFIASRKEIFEKAKHHFSSLEYTLEDLEHFNESFSIEIEVFGNMTEKDYDETLSLLVSDFILLETCKKYSLRKSTYFKN